MPIPRLGQVAIVGAAAIMSLLLVGCGDDQPSGPRADQAGRNLAVQVYKILLAATVIDTKITDPLDDNYVPCGDDKVKVTYAVNGTATSFATIEPHVTRTETKKVATPRQIIDDLVSYMPQVGTFSVTRSGDATAQLVSRDTFTRLTLHSPGPNKLAVTGETSCLRGGDRPIH
jgi:hypothetical protein